MKFHTLYKKLADNARFDLKLFLISLMALLLLTGCNALQKTNNEITFVASRGSPASQVISWSPTDENEILVTASEIGQGQTEVYILNRETGSKEILAQADYGIFFESAWTTDGKHVLLLIGDNTEGFEPRGWWMVNTENKSAEYILDFVTAAWSPDGNTIATFHSGKQNGEIVNIDLRLINATNKTEEIAYTSTEMDHVSGLSWSPNGQYLTFPAGRGPSTDLYTFNIKTKQLMKITENQLIDNPVWSPTGNIIAFEKRSTTDFRITLHLITSDGKCEIEIPNIENVSSPTWSPDGKKLAYIARDGIYFVDLEHVFGRDIYQGLCE